ncbi:MAG: AAA family ATPase [Bacteroidaceae bacterium]|nr:AAA family ATPase [Bacteroidaceae bacterium]
MTRKNLYIISGPNGAGKTTVSMTLLTEVFNCREYVNADAIAAGLSPFNPESMALLAGRLMLTRIEDLLSRDETFALETTLATRSYRNLVRRAQQQGYFVSLVYFWLESPEVAIQRVALRVSEGGHNIQEEVIRRRYSAGMKNFFNIYMPIVDYWMLVDNTRTPRTIVAEGGLERPPMIRNVERYNLIYNYGNAKVD